MDGPYAQADRIDAYALRVRYACSLALTELGGRIQDDLQTRLSEAYPPASEPGEYPHRRSGQLAAGIVPKVSTVDDGQQLSVVSVREGGNPDVPKLLNEGTSKMQPRPYAQMTRDQWRDDAAPVVIQSMRSQLT